MPSTQSKRRAVDTWQPLTNFYHVVSVIVSVIAMSRQQPISFRFADHPSRVVQRRNGKCEDEAVTR